MLKRSRNWLAYEDGSYEPVDPMGSLNRKKRGPGREDWWVVEKDQDWSPPWGKERTMNAPSKGRTGTRTGAKEGASAAGQRRQSIMSGGLAADPLFTSAHAAARLTPVTAKGKPEVRLLDNGLDPSVRVEVKDQNKSGEGKPGSHGGPNALRDEREMEAAAKKAGLDEKDNILRPGPMLDKELAWEQAPEPGVTEKIAKGLGELADKARAGIAEAFEKGGPAMVEASGKALEALSDEEIYQGIEEAFAEGIQAGGKAIKDTAVTFVCDERMHDGLKKAGLFALGGVAVPVTMIGGGYVVAMAPEVAIALESRFPGAVQAAGEFVQGAADKVSPPAPTYSGVIGAGVGAAIDKALE